MGSYQPQLVSGNKFEDLIDLKHDCFQQKRENRWGIHHQSTPRTMWLVTKEKIGEDVGSSKINRGVPLVGKT